MRNAGSTLWNFYKNNELGGDAIETLGYAGLSAAGQAMFTDMEADQIATATAVGAAAAMASRQPGRMLGGYFGKMYDDTGRSVNPVLKSPDPPPPPKNCPPGCVSPLDPQAIAGKDLPSPPKANC